MDQLNNIEDYVTVGWLMVNVRPIKHVLKSLVSKWKYQFTCYLANRVSVHTVCTIWHLYSFVS